MEANLDTPIETNVITALDRHIFAYTSKKEAEVEKLKKGIWVYFFLLIFEGSLRKWVFPGLATPLLVVRDPVAIWLLYNAWKNGLMPSNAILSAIYLCTFISFFAALIFGHGNIVVAIYGTRILLFHFPLIFLIGNVFTKADVIKIGKMLLWLSIPMAVLIAFQFYSPQTAFVNRGIGAGSEGGGFSGALGYYRPPGTFSFTTGNTQFFGFVAVFVIYFLLNPRLVNRILLIAATISVLIAIPLSISRTLFFQIIVSIIFAITSIARNPRFLWRMIAAIFGLFFLVAILSRTSFIEKALSALTTRFVDADESEGGLQNTFGNRILAGLFEPFLTPGLPFFGYGIGMGTNAGAQLLVGHSDEFLISEGEWGRLVGEMGAILGFAVIFIRLRLCFQFVNDCYKRLSKGDILPWIILSVSFQAIAQGEWAQPTALGFGVFMGGLTIAACRLEETKPNLLER